MSEQPEIHIAADGPIDVDVVMQQIREYLLARKSQSSSDGAAVPHFNGRFNPMVYEQLYRANLVYDQLYITRNVIPSRVPIVGPMLSLLRRKLHELILYYVNQLAQKQITFNLHLLNAVNALVQELESLSVAEITDLQHKVGALRQQIEILEEYK